MTIQEHNAPLKDKMEKSGFKLISKDGKRYFVDTSGKYEPYPVGYITGPNSFERGYYISIQGKDGWLQRSSYNLSELEKWAVEIAQKELAETWG